MEGVEWLKEMDWSCSKAASLTEKRGMITLSKSKIEAGRYTLVLNGLYRTIRRIRVRRSFSLSA